MGEIIPPPFKFLNNMEKYIKLLAQYINRGYELLCGVPKDKHKLLHVVVSATVTALLSHVIPFVGLLLVMTLILWVKRPMTSCLAKVVQSGKTLLQIM